MYTLALTGGLTSNGRKIESAEWRRIIPALFNREETIEKALETISRFFSRSLQPIEEENYRKQLTAMNFCGITKRCSYVLNATEFLFLEIQD